MATGKHSVSFFELIRNKKVMIPVVSVLAVILVLSSLWLILSPGWKSGKRVMPAFLADMGLLQGKSFTYFDGITINGVDVSGMTLERAKAAVGRAESNRQVPYAITVSVNGRSCLFTEQDFSYEPSNDNALKEAKSYCVSIMRGKTQKAPKAFYTDLTFSAASRKAMADKAAAALNCEPVNATFDGISGGQANFTEAVEGVTVDNEDLFRQLEAFLTSGQSTGEITVSYTAKEAQVTKASLEKNVTKLATSTSRSTNTADATSNMRKAIQMCNGSVIEPGQTWSFNNHTGNSNIEASGWKKAVEYRGGKQAWGIGGGICQASSCIYDAALRAGMEVVERHYHYWASSYAKPGFDATIDYPSLDLRLKNNTEYPMYFECLMGGNEMTVNIYGYQSDSYDQITLSGRETKRVPGDYYTVSATRTWWKNGQVVKTEDLGVSKYSLKSKTWEGQSTTPSSSVPVTPSQPPESSSTPPSSSETPSSSEPTQSEPPESSSTPSSSSETPSSSEPESSEPSVPAEPIEEAA